MTEIELKPCPFCGGTAELVEEHDHAWIRHSGCPSDMGGFVYAEEAVNTWNRRQVPLTLSQDVINLVISSREFWDANNDLSNESRALDNALSAFANIVPYENEPHDAILSDDTPVGPEDEADIRLFNEAIAAAKERLKRRNRAKRIDVDGACIRCGGVECMPEGGLTCTICIDAILNRSELNGADRRPFAASPSPLSAGDAGEIERLIEPIMELIEHRLAIIWARPGSREFFADELRAEAGRLLDSATHP